MIIYFDIQFMTSDLELSFQYCLYRWYWFKMNTSINIEPLIVKKKIRKNDIEMLRSQIYSTFNKGEKLIKFLRFVKLLIKAWRSPTGNNMGGLPELPTFFALQCDFD